MAPNDMTRFNVGFFWFAAVQFGLVGLVARRHLPGAELAGAARLLGLAGRRWRLGARAGHRGSHGPALAGDGARCGGGSVGHLCGHRTPIASRERQERVDEHIAADPWLSPGGSALQGLAICLLLLVGAFAVLSFIYGDWLVGAVAAVVFLAAAVGAAVGLRVWGRRWRRRPGPPEERTSALPDGLDSDGGDSGGPRGRGRSLRRRTALVIVVGVVLLVLAVWAITQGATLVGLGILVLYTPLVIATVIALRTAAQV